MTITKGVSPRSLVMEDSIRLSSVPLDLSTSMSFTWITLINRHFGKKIIAKRTGMSEEDPKVEILWLRLYKVCSPLMKWGFADLIDHD
jgi:hypothetical protein